MDSELRGVSSKAPAALLRALTEELAAGLRFESAGGVEVERRLRAGEVADVVVLAGGALDRLAREGVLEASPVRALFRSDTVLAVPEGAPAPRLATEDDLVTTLGGAARIACSTGPSGAALRELLREWDLAALEDRLVEAPAGVPVATLLADGRADVGVQQRSELAGAPGVRVVGPLPGRAAVTTTFAGAVTAASTRPRQAAAALERLAGGPRTAALVEAHGMTLAR